MSYVENKTISYSYTNSDYTSQNFSLVYQVETSQHDEEADIKYSNLLQMEFYNIDDALYIINAWQKAGYINIHMMTSIKQNNITVLEDSSSEVTIEGSQNILSLLYKEYAKTEQLEKQLQLFNQFLTKYNALERFEQFTKEQTEFVTV